jgi:aminoglycoside phosphotransferase family enzyme
MRGNWTAKIIEKFNDYCDKNASIERSQLNALMHGQRTSKRTKVKSNQHQKPLGKQEKTQAKKKPNRLTLLVFQFMPTI